MSERVGVCAEVIGRGIRRASHTWLLGAGGVPEITLMMTSVVTSRSTIDCGGAAGVTEKAICEHGRERRTKSGAGG